MNSEWKVVGQKLVREFSFVGFKESMIFVNNVAEIAERENHHPDIHMYYNRVVIELWTHSAGGLTDKDYGLAEKIDKIS